MKLYTIRGTCSLAPHIVAHETGLPIDIEEISRKTNATASGVRLRSIPSNAYVPLLQLDDGSVLSEGPAILQYLADQHPESKLAPPAGSFERYRLQEWLNFVATELHKPWAALFYPATSDEQKTPIREKLSQRIDVVAEQLRHSTYLLGSQFTIADAYVFSVLRWAYYSGVSLPTIVGTYMLHVGARPGVQRALKAERLKR